MMYKVNALVDFAHFFEDQAFVRSLELMIRPFIVYGLILTTIMSITVISV